MRAVENNRDCTYLLAARLSASAIAQEPFDFLPPFEMPRFVNDFRAGCDRIPWRPSCRRVIERRL